MSKMFLIIGGVFIIIGMVFLIMENKEFKWLSWLGNLPGDVRIEKGNFRLYIPFTSMLILSLVISLIFRLIKKFFE